jgi:hypothetical protein
MRYDEIPLLRHGTRLVFAWIGLVLGLDRTEQWDWAVVVEHYYYVRLCIPLSMVPTAVHLFVFDCATSLKEILS